MSDRIYNPLEVSTSDDDDGLLEQSSDTTIPETIVDLDFQQITLLYACTCNGMDPSLVLEVEGGVTNHTNENLWFKPALIIGALLLIAGFILRGKIWR